MNRLLPTEVHKHGARAIEAIKTFPLPAQNATSQENYQRILRWLYDGGQDGVASLVIDLGEIRTNMGAADDTYHSRRYGGSTAGSTAVWLRCVIGR